MVLAEAVADIELEECSIASEEDMMSIDIVAEVLKDAPHYLQWCNIGV